MKILLDASLHDDNVVDLYWSNSLGENPVYEVYRKLNTDLNYMLLGKINEETYSDKNKKDIYVPTKPKVLSTYVTGKDKVFISVISYDSEISYEYMIKANFEGKEYQSNVLDLDINTGIKEYKYLSVPVDNDQSTVVHDGEFSSSASSSITVERLVPGYNAIVIKAVDLEGNESDEETLFIYIDTDVAEDPTIGTGIGVPVGVRYNNRYRGPQESQKVNFTYQQIRLNINNLKKKLNELDIMKKYMTAKPTYSVVNTMETIDNIEQVSKIIRKC